MKITIDVDCTPEEARSFLGLPDVKPMQEAMLADAQTRLKTAMASVEPEALMKLWLPAGVDGLERVQKAFWSHLQGKHGPEK